MISATSELTDAVHINCSVRITITSFAEYDYKKFKGLKIHSISGESEENISLDIIPAASEANRNEFYSYIDK